jgi:hypothetical protein
MGNYYKVQCALNFVRRYGWFPVAVGGGVVAAGSIGANSLKGTAYVFGQ